MNKLIALFLTNGYLKLQFFERLELRSCYYLQGEKQRGGEAKERLITSISLWYHSHHHLLLQMILLRRPWKSTPESTGSFSGEKWRMRETDTHLVIWRDTEWNWVNATLEVNEEEKQGLKERRIRWLPPLEKRA